jgi:hypothetical protein
MLLELKELYADEDAPEGECLVVRMRVTHVAAVHHDQTSRPGKYRFSYKNSFI